ncbi:MAG TPA: HEAT repeat domain-containing protein [Coriobacteriia bacterium]
MTELRGRPQGRGSHDRGARTLTPGTSHTLVDMLLDTDPVSHREFERQLLHDLVDTDARVRWRAAFDLACVGAPSGDAIAALASAALHDTDASVRTHAARALVAGGSAAAAALVTRLLDGADHERSTELLAALGAPAVDALATALEGDDPSVRWAAGGALEDIASGDAVQALIGALTDDDDEVRHCAVTALGHIGVPAVDALLATLSDVSPVARSEAARALGYQSDSRSFMPLIVALDDADAEVRGSAAWALGGLHDPRGLVPLLVALDDEDARVREGAAAGLGRSGDARAVRPLITAIDDEDDSVRCRTVTALGELGATRALPFLIATLTCDASEDVRYAAADALGELGAAAVQPLLEAMDGEGEDARGWIALALESLGAPVIERSVAQHDCRLGPAHVREALGWTDEGRAAAV